MVPAQRKHYNCLCVRSTNDFLSKVLCASVVLSVQTHARDLPYTASLCRSIMSAVGMFVSATNYLQQCELCGLIFYEKYNIDCAFAEPWMINEWKCGTFFTTRMVMMHLAFYVLAPNLNIALTSSKGPR